MTQIQLTDTNQGYLDLLEDADIPITFSVAEIRDLTKRKGAFSKTIRLAGSKNNNTILSNLFDVNIVNGSFNINKLQKCQVLQDGVPILQNGYIQLLSVNKVQTTNRHDQEVYYEAVVKDDTSDFFTKLGNSELTDLNFPQQHVYNVTNIQNSWAHTVDDVYKYIMPMNTTDSEYDITEFLPGIYAKQYFDQIFARAGFQYEWIGMTAPDTQFDKLIVPYNGDKPKLEATEQDVYRVEATRSTSLVQTSPGNLATGKNSSTATTNFVVNTEVLDQNNNYNPTLGRYNPPFHLSATSGNNANVQITATVQVALVNAGLTAYVQSTSSLAINPKIKIKPELFIRKNGGSSTGAATPPLFTANTVELATGLMVPTGTTIVSTQTITRDILVSDLLPTDFIDTATRTLVEMPNNRFASSTIGGIPSDVDIQITFSNIQLKIVPSVNLVSFGAILKLNKFIPLKVKQSDFIKSIFTMYNLYVYTDKNQPNKLFLQSRDSYYDSGVVTDWTKKLNKEKDQSLQFLPELGSKKVTLSYKQDKDAINEGYFNITNEVYGQQDFTYDNEYIKGEEKKEIIFSPTPTTTTPFGAFVPAIVGAEPKNNIRILYDGGMFNSTDSWSITQYTGNTVSMGTLYPYFGHFDDPTGPTFDINFGVCDYYFYANNLWTGFTAKTNNNLYNLHWRRTFNQINSNKMLTAMFDLNASDIANMKLNDKIRIDNSYWNINKVIDYNPNKPGPTKVELVSVDAELKLAPFKTGKPVLPGKGDTVLTPVREMGAIREATLNVGGGGVMIYGKGNIVAPDSTGMVIGDNNVISAPAAFVIGNDIVANEPGLYVGNTLLTSTSSIISVEDITYNALKDLADNAQLTPYKIYKITDYADYYRSGEPVWVQAITESLFATSGIRQMKIVKGSVYTPSGANKGVWAPSLTVAINDIVIWGGRCWINIGGAIGSSIDDFTLDAVNWAVTTSASLYEEKLFNIKFEFYNVSTDYFLIREQSDDRGNVITADESSTSLSITDWGDPRIYRNNVLYGIFNNRSTSGEIVGNSNKGYIARNTVTLDISSNSNNGYIADNTGSGSILENSNNGYIADNTVTSTIRRNSNNGRINLNTNTGTIEQNSNGGIISSNLNGGNIINNSNLFAIFNNSNTGVIGNNSNLGTIQSNSNGGFISGNSNTGNIINNSNTGRINVNSNKGQIFNNSNTGVIEYNSCGGQIEDNTNAGDISYNNNLTRIYNNSNVGDITENTNAGAISNNTNKVSDINNNMNNGDIDLNDSALVGPFSITYNTNNGLISDPTMTANITDPIVNKV